MEALKVDKHCYHVPSHSEVANVLQKGLQSNFETVSVEVVDCPDLRQKPFMLAAQGICGKPRICDIGGVPNLIPLPNLSKVYNFPKMAKLAEVPDGFFVGAAAGPFHFLGTNSELMPNIKCGHDTNNQTHYALIEGDNKAKVDQIPAQCQDCCLMANVLLSEGKPGKVLKISAKKRIGEDNFTLAIRKALKQQYGTNPVGLGGVFLIKAGKAKFHVMPKFSETPLKSDEDVEKWLHFFEFGAPIVCLTVMHSHDPGWDLRIDHTHCFSDHGVGGHYHYDTTPEIIEYEAYLNVAEFLYRIDAPTETHMIGRD